MAAQDGSRIPVGRWFVHTISAAAECLSIPGKRVRAALLIPASVRRVAGDICS